MILLYHRVTRLQTDPQLLAVSPARFAAHLEVLARTMRPMPLTQMVAAAQAGDLPERAVAVTFDDGYADNLHEAEPLLRRFGVPATVFATTGRTGGTEEFFWDELDRLLLQPNTLPRSLTLTAGGTPMTFDLAACWRYTPEMWEAAKGWDVLQPAAPGSRQQLYLDLCRAIHVMPAEGRAAALADLRRWAGVESAGRASHRMMDAAELKRLAAGDLVEVGGHTVEHPLLAAESVDRQRAEIATNRRALGDIIGRPVTSFAYPFGCRRDYTPDTVAAVSAAGYALACSNFTGRVGAGTDPLQLPRFIVRDWDATRLTEQLATWLDRP